MFNNKRIFSKLVILGLFLFSLLAINSVRAASVFVFNKNLGFGSIGNDVKELQKYLNNNKYFVAKTGPGSKGKETNYFGLATKTTLIKFQKFNTIKPANGFFDTITRKIVNLLNKIGQESSVKDGGVSKSKPPTNNNGFAIGGTITGLGGPVTIQNSNQEVLTINPGANSSFTFPTKLSANTNYAVTIKQNYLGQACYIKDNTGTVTNSNVSNIKIACGINLYFNPFEFRSSNSVAQYTITSSAGANGTITPTETISYGTNKTFTITPNEGYNIEDVLVDNVSIGMPTSYTFTNVTANHIISATFANSCGGVSSVSYGDQTYSTVSIGSQCWFKENLNIGTEINNGISEPDCHDVSGDNSGYWSCQVNNNAIEKYCYGDDPTNCSTNGGLYEWAETLGLPYDCNNAASVDNGNGTYGLTCPDSGEQTISAQQQGICPTGWHVPSFNEYQTLIQVSDPGCILSNENCNTAGEKLKANSEHLPIAWDGTDTYNFSTLPSGERTNSGEFSHLSNYAFLWSSTSGLSNPLLGGFINLSSGSSAAGGGDINKVGGFSVRCVKNYDYSLVYSAGVNGSITGFLYQAVNQGFNGVAVTAIPSTGYHFVSWSDNSTNNPRTDLNVRNNISVTANFEINSYTLTYTAGTNGTVTGNSSQTVDYGNNATPVTAAPNTGYYFVNWSDNYFQDSRTDINISSNINVTAIFAPISTFTSCGDIIFYGNEVYPTVQIGSQCWFAKNLNIGTKIIATNSEPDCHSIYSRRGNDYWSCQVNSNTIEKYCYDNSDVNCATDGGLYEWAEAVQLPYDCNNATRVDNGNGTYTLNCPISGNQTISATQQGICPTGWHIPSISDYQTLAQVSDPACDLAGATCSTAGDKLKASSERLLIPWDGTDIYSFSALPSGYRHYTSSFYSRGDYAYLWSSTPDSDSLSSLAVNLGSADPSISGPAVYRVYGVSVRCVKD